MKRILLFLFFTYLLHSFAFCQQYTATIKHFGIDEGLSNNEVNAIAKDERGVIWIGTKHGLNRFDGKRFKVFSVSQGLSDNKISNLICEGRYLWICYKDIIDNYQEIPNIDIFDTYNEKVLPIEKFMGEKMPFKWKEVASCKIRNGVPTFILTNNQHFIYQINKGFSLVKGLRVGETIVGAVPGKEVWTLAYSSDTIHLIKRKIDGTFVGKTNFELTNNQPEFHLLTEKDGGSVWTYNPDIRAFNITQIINIYPDFSAKVLSTTPQPLWFPIFRSTYHPTLDGIWVSDENNMFLYGFDGKIRYSHFKGEDIRNLRPARQTLIDGDVIWQCSDNGLYIITVKPNYFYPIFNSPTPTNAFRSIRKVENTYFFCAAEGVYTLTDSLHPTVPNGLSSCIDKQGNYWTGNYNRLYVYSPQTHSYKTYHSSIESPWGMLADNDGNILLSEQGIVSFNPATEALTEINYGAYPELRRNVVYYFYPISENNYFLCSSSGLYEFDIKTKRILARYWSGGNGKYYLPVNDLRHLYYDKETQTYWITTGGFGLLKWQPSLSKSEIISFSEGLSNTLHGVYPDDFGYLWISTDKGIIQLDKKNTAKRKIYTQQDGILTDEFNRISHFQDDDGSIYFGSISGITHFHPKNFKNTFNKNEHIKPIIIEIDQYLGSSNRLENVTADFIATKQINFDADDRFFTLTLGLTSAEWTKESVFYYQLQGVDSIWTKAEGNQFTFGRLPYGEQTIRIKALLINGQFADEILEVKVYVERPFYLRPWFFILAIAGIVAIVYWRIRDLNLRNMELEKEVERRTETIELQKLELQKLDEMKSRFFANVSHELRTPLTLIINPLNQLLKYENWDNEKKRLIAFAHQNSQKLLRLVNEILDLTKLESSTLSLSEDKTALTSFGKRILAEFESFAAKEEIDLYFDTNLSPHQTVLLDNKKVETILYNLIGNAIKFTPNGGKITLTIQETEDNIVFNVTDNGRGIPEKDLPFIFNRFYQSKNNKNEGGSGIGLALSRELSLLMGGNIYAQSKEHEGSSFFLTLPKKLVFDAALEEEVVMKKTVEIAINDSPKVHQPNLPTLLLVEDNHDLQGYIAEMLRQQYKVVTANHGQLALDYLQSHLDTLPDLIISDVMMPVLDGYQLLERLKSNSVYQKIPIIMLTARAGLEDRLHALRIGVDDYLTKPFVQEELLARIENLLANAYARQSKEKVIITETFAEEEEVLEENGLEAETDADTPQSLEWLAEVEKYIIANLHVSNFSVEHIAEAFEMSRFKFSRTIKTMVGLSAIHYIQEIRFRQARILLETKVTTSVAATAEAVGISKVKYFSQQFKQRFGKSPSDFLE